MNANRILLIILLGYLPALSNALTISQVPLNLGGSGTPLIMLSMERDHKLYYEAYDDRSDITGDGKLDIRYSPSITYYGYFDSFKCYTYSSGVFTPSAITVNKQCSNKWSGDFLNYLTMSRMDALRRVLYGGKRSTDSATATVLERSYIPQDAHSWGKEYTSTALDGYDISLYAPLSQPALGTRHLFANTTLLCPVPSGFSADTGCSSNSGLPLLRVLNDSNFRIWEWLSIERPVAGTQCATGQNVRTNCAVAGVTNQWLIVPGTYFSGLTQTTYNTTGYGTYPSNHGDFVSLVNTYGNILTNPNTVKQFGTGPASNINGSGNPFSSASGSQDNYLTVFSGNLVIPAGQAGSYKFAVDGDDAVELTIDNFVVASWYGGHGTDNSSSGLSNHSGTVTLSAGTHSIQFLHQEKDGGDSYFLYWQKTLPDSNMTDYVVRVQACVTGLLETNECRGYPATAPTVFKPVGILQQYGENDRMAFGLISGSYTKNESGGVLRKNISTFTDEINTATGQFNTSTNGIIKTLDALKVVGFENNYFYDQSCGVPEVSGPLSEGRCRMWGNPTAEMMFEGLRYFAGKSGGTSSYNYSGTTDDSTLGLPAPAWLDPYRTTTGGYPSCSKPSQLVISDITPNYDTDQLPGRHQYTLPSSTPAFSSDISGLNVEGQADTIWKGEYGLGATKSLFVGQSGENYDGAPTPKTVTSFGSMRGLSPEEPTEQGGFYAGSVALYGKTNDLSAAGDTFTCPGSDPFCASKYQQTDTFSVVLSSPFPRIEFPIVKSGVTNIIKVVPFAKTVGGCMSTSAQGQYQPTNQIVDVYVDTIANTNSSNGDSSINNGRPYAKLRINFEDSEYGSDHDMDAIAEYELTAKSDGTLDIKASSNYAAGGCIQHMGYVISGTSTDGIYLEIRDPDTAAGSDVDYYLDTPHNRGAGNPLPTSTLRNFSVGTNTSAAFVDHDPLWYAAKWGGFVDINKNNQLDEISGVKEWDNRDTPDGVPDSYFLVTNATKLKQQLDRTFTEILARSSSSSSVATSSTSLRTGNRIYQAKYNSSDWSGQLLQFQLSKAGVLGASPEWDAGSKINAQNAVTGRVIITKGTTGGLAFSGTNLTTPALAALKTPLDKNSSSVVDTCGLERLNYLRGDTSHEATGGSFTCASGSVVNNFRQRPTSRLGDIVDSDPWYVGAPAAGLSDVDFPGYNAFRRGKLSRKPVVYVGSNDGMLHGFDASLTGVTATNPGTPTSTAGNEVLAYVPTQVFPNLSKLTAQTYNQNHLYFVDGSPFAGDVDLGSSNWHTVLIAAMGGGGKGYYALDVTDPTTFSESNASNLLLWEFDTNAAGTGTGDVDMGYAYNLSHKNFATTQSQQIVRMANGKWAAILGNGYNSANGKAVLYVVFIKEGIDGIWTLGTDYIKLVADAPTTRDNGLSSPIPFDSDDDGTVDTIYAGDLKGNVWKFLVGPNASDASVAGTTSTWKVAFSSGTCGGTTPSTCLPLFQAKDSTSKAQPILGPLDVTNHPNDGQLVMFGTGKYIEPTDSTNTDTQTFYGIWDRNDGTTRIGTRAADLLKQTLSATACSSPPTAGVACTFTDTGGTFRIPSANPINWRKPNPPSPPVGNSADCTPAATCNPTHLGWYIDLPASGERVTGVPTFINGFIFFNTLIPPTTVCDSGTGWLMVLGYQNGGLPGRVIIDSKGTGTFAGLAVGGLQVGASIGGSTYVTPPDTTTTVGVAVTSNSGGAGGLGTTLINPFGGSLRGRLNWQEIPPP